LPRNGVGTFNLVAGNPVVSGTTIQSSWANNTLTDIAGGLTSSLSRDGQAAMTGPLPMGSNDIQNAGNITANANMNAAAFVPTGAAVPANGLYLSAANTPALASNSALRWSVNATGNHVMAAPSAGTTLALSTTSILQVGASLTDGVVTSQWQSAGAGTGALFGTTSGHTLSLITNNVVRGAITTAGNITVNAPSSGTTLTALSLTTAQSIIAGITGSANNPRLFVTHTESTGTTDIQATGTTTGSMTLSTFGFVRQTISAAGNVTISAPSAGNTVQIYNLSGAIGLSMGTPGTSTLLGAGFTGISLNTCQIVANGPNNIRISQNQIGSDGAGNGGNYGNTNPAAAYSIGSGQHSWLVAPSGTVGTTITWTAAMTLANAGNVTISAPSSGTTLTAISVASGTPISFNDGSGAGYLSFDGAHNLIWGTGGAFALNLQTNGSTRISANSTGNVTINAPSSGTTLALTGIAGNTSFSVTDGTRTFGLQQGASGTAFGSTSNHATSLLANNVVALAANPAGGQVAITGTDITARGVALVALQAADQNVNNSVALVDATNLQLSLAVGTYRVRILTLFLQSNAGNAGLNVGVYASGGTITNPPSQIWYKGHVAGNSPDNYSNIQSSSATIFTTGAGVALSLGPNPCDWLEWEGIVKVTVATSLRVCFAQQTATAINTTLKAGSCMEVVQLS